MTSNNNSEPHRGDRMSWTTCFVRFGKVSEEQEVQVASCEEHIKEMRRLGCIDRVPGLERAEVVRLQSEVEEVNEWAAKAAAYRLLHPNNLCA